jgi:tetratricopeptide (TPR) repeat protein
MRAPITLAFALMIASMTACAADPLVTRWVDRWLAMERSGMQGDPQAIEGFEALVEAAPTLYDADAARFGQARALRAQGRYSEAFALFEGLGDRAMRRMDRSRARYEMGRMAATAGRVEAAIAIFRHLVETYPGQPAAMRSLQLLRHFSERSGGPAERDALNWLHRVYPTLASTAIADDLVYHGVEILYRWWRHSDSALLARQVEGLIGRLESRHYVSGHWDDAVWLLSRLYHRQGRFEDEIRALGRILQTREEPFFVGHYDTTYHWVGLLRIARIHLMDLDAPEVAAQTYEWFVTTFPYSRWRDDARFWQGCAWLRAGEPESAELAFASIAEIYPDSKYLARLDAARSDPHSALCEPTVFEEGNW